ncbi:hypothetical protein AB1Y20_016940 [Prymnesium parvum]|uniref:Uncharacterized protein n=1 Tax=Prymnesium parvum TaxID=97485 RepID=A0AB34ICE3_PRYPA
MNRPAAAFSWHSFRIELACLLRRHGAEHRIWLTRAHAVRYDAVRTNNMVALDNSDAYACLDSNARDRMPAAARAAPPLRSRVRVEWGDEWYAGIVTSRKQGLNSNGASATLHRVLYDATARHRATACWHDFCEVNWRAE